jgi:diguanylate cyclase (GGDEF)-like protein
MTRDLLSDVEAAAYEIDWVTSYDSAIDKINNGHHDVYLFDYRLGEHTGLDLIIDVIGRGSNIPIILLTGQGDHDVDVSAMKAGAMDYLVKGQINSFMLERAIRYAIERKRTEEQIFRMAFYDSLTNLPNRVLFLDRLKQAISHAERNQHMLAVMFLDIDNFKRINDTFGHHLGDELLKGCADRLTGVLRKSDAVTRQIMPDLFARLGGDEFTVLLTEIRDASDAALVARRILKVLSRPFVLDNRELFISTSIGIAIYPHDGKDVDSLLKNADAAMYHAKGQGKNNYQYYMESMNASALERLTLENDLRKAIEREEFILYYQPRMHIRTGKISGVEALIRWIHPEKGLIPPDKFIPLAEETNLITYIDEWVLKNACMQGALWQKSGHTSLYLSVNISGTQFKHETLLEIIAESLSESGFNQQNLELEITESAIMENASSTLAVLYKLNKMGVNLSMDDFGTGYCSFSYLKSFPLDIIKIDRSFITDINKTEEDAAIVKAIISMSHNLKLTVIAEGVETEEQLSLLRKMGCDEMQGYLLSNPLPVDQIEAFLLKNSDLINT